MPNYQGVWSLSTVYQATGEDNWPDVTAPIGIFAGGTGNINRIDQFVMTTSSSVTDFGDLTQGTSEMVGVSSSTRGVFGGGNSGSQENTIQYITMRSAGNATDFGDLTAARSLMNTINASNETRGLLAGGAASGTYAAVVDIDYVTIATTGNASDFGDLISAIKSASGAGSSTRGVFGGGESSGSTTINDRDWETIVT